MRGSQTRLRLPARVRRGDAITAQWANEIVSALDTLNRRAQPEQPRRVSPSAPGTHPFKLSVSYDSDTSEYRLKAHYGRVTATIWKANGASAATIASREVAVGYDSGTGASGKLVGDDFSLSSEGYLVLADSTTYGIWLTVPVTAVAELVRPASGGEYRTVTSYHNESSATIVSDSTNTESSDAGTKSTGGAVYYYLGQVVTSDDGTSTVKQYRRSDVSQGLGMLPTGLVSTDDDNSLVAGTDGALWAPPIVSTDADNSISAGSDGGAFYEEPPP
jgi:hypothetical protein